MNYNHRANASNFDDEIVISGISGKFPRARNVAEFSENLYNKVDMVTDDEKRWRNFNPEIPRRMGTIVELDKFDSTFFGVHFKQAHTMDPQCRLLMETAYEAVFDAGINPKSLHGSKTGVYIGACFSESEKTWFYEKMSTGGFGITGCSRAMFPNRISYTLGLNGPSLLVDTACSSSMYAFDLAYTAFRNGEIDAAIVGGSNLLLHPYVTLQFSRLGVLAADGFCRPFDASASGYVRSEAICALFLQRQRDAKRNYATVMHSKTNCDGYKAEGITYPSGQIQQKLLTELYSEIAFDPRKVDYIEAHSTGTIVGDPEECHALDNVFCQRRTKPLLVGSVKSNIGHTEPASGVCSIVKAILAYETSLVAPNLHFQKIRPGIPSLEQGRLKICTEPTPLNGEYIGVNCFGFGGANAHALLRGNRKSKNKRQLNIDEMPRLVTWSGRTEDAIKHVMSTIESQQIDIEFISLLHNIQSEETPGHIFRGYGLFYQDGPTSSRCVTKEIQHYSGLKRPIVWLFSGMGSQWNTMGTSFMGITAFRESIERCHDILIPLGLDLKHIITTDKPEIFENILHSFVGIAAIQIGLVSILRSVGFQPDYLVGHSVGELGCAYADGCLTVEQMILSAYSRGKASIETKVITGAMAAIAMGYEKISNILPEKIQIACHNSNESVTISGPKSDILDFIKAIKQQGVLAKEVQCSHIAFHSKYITEMGPNLLNRQKTIIPMPVKRSEKWLSTSVPQADWRNRQHQYCSAEYLTNNLLSPVLFEETVKLLPENAITIEIAPHSMFVGILTKSMPRGLHIPLQQRNASNNLDIFMNALGRLHVSGVTLSLTNLYPPIDYPVSRGTAMISPLIKWDHSQEWYVTKFALQKSSASGERKVKVSISDQDYDFIVGHVIDGRCLFPASAYLQLVWEALALMKGPIFFDMNVEFEDVRFLRATSMTKGQSVDFNIMIHYGTGCFEITERFESVVTGIIREVTNPKPLTILTDTVVDNYLIVTQDDFYKELRLRGYNYSGTFKSVIQSRSDGEGGKVKWDMNWISFIDCLLQIVIFGKDTRQLHLPLRVEKIRINSTDHMSKSLALPTDKSYFDVLYCPKLDTLVSGGIEIRGMHTHPIARRKLAGTPVLERYTFVPYLNSASMTIIDVARVCIQIILENNPTWMSQLKCTEITGSNDTMTMSIIDYIKEAVEDLPMVTGHYSKVNRTTESDFGTNNHLVILIDSYAATVAENLIQNHIIDNGYLICRFSSTNPIEAIVSPNFFKLIGSYHMPNESIGFFQRETVQDQIPLKKSNIIIIPKYTIDGASSLIWLSKVQAALRAGESIILLVYDDPMSGILGLVNCIRREPNGYRVRCVFIMDREAPQFDQNLPFFKTQLDLDLVFNVYRKGCWGSYRHLKLVQNIQDRPTRNHAFVNILQKGDLSTLRWFEGPLQPREDPSLVRVQFSSLNFRDVMLATGRLATEVMGTNRLQQECVLGFEYSGVNERGERCMGMSLSGALATHIIPIDCLTWRIPDSMSLRDAATIPVVYITVYSAFFLSNPIKKGKTILIHAGSGGIGLAAIRVALAYGLEVYTTVSTAVKRRFLLDTFPQLKEINIGCSRDCSFEPMIKLQTNGMGVNYVLNSLSDDKLHASLRCLSPGGVFLEIGKFDLVNDTKIGLGHFIKEMTYRTVLVDHLFSTSPSDRRFLFNLIEQDLQSGVIKPIHSKVFQVGEIEKAYRHLCTGKHVGKVLIRIREAPHSDCSLPIKLIPRCNFNADHVYIVVGGLGGFGMELVDWMVIRGVKKVILSSKNGITKSYQSHRIRIWKQYECRILVSTADISTLDECDILIKVALAIGPVGGIFNVAAILNDGLLENQTIEQFNAVMSPKALATQHLDYLSRQLCPKLKYFVVFSSVSCGRGNAGQTNYGMANSIMERICEDRYAADLPAKAIQWGTVGDVGLVAKMFDENKIDVEIGGTLQQSISSCLAELDALLSDKLAPIVCSMVVAEKRLQMNSERNVVDSVLNIIGIRDIKCISMTATLAEIGMDSLMAVEIKQTLEREFEIFLTSENLRSLTFAKLENLVESYEAKCADQLSETISTKPNAYKTTSTDSDLQGINYLLRNIGDETTSYEMLLDMKNVKINENNRNQKTLSNAQVLIVPGIEGVAGKAWCKIIERVKLPAHLLQLTKITGETSISEFLNEVVEPIKSSIFKNVEHFYLVGYSFGALVALQLARLLEEAGMKGHILLIDGAPAYLRQLSLINLPQNSSSISEETIQTILLYAIVQNIFLPETVSTVMSKLNNSTQWEQKIEQLIECERTMDHTNSYSDEYLKLMANGLYGRIKIIIQDNVQCTSKLKSSITLIRPVTIAVTNIIEDYELSEWTIGQVTVKFIDGNHQTMLDNDRISDIINEHDPNLLSEKEFYNSYILPEKINN